MHLLPLCPRSLRPKGDGPASVTGTRPGLLLSNEHAAIFRSACTTILDINDALFLTGTIARPRNIRHMQKPYVRLCLFDGFWKRTAFQTGVAAIECKQVGTILRSLLAALAQSWPPDWVPDHLGILTDGSGIVFCPELPSPEAEDWPERVVSNDVSAVDLLPFVPGSPWSKLNAAISHSHH